MILQYQNIFKLTSIQVKLPAESEDWQKRPAYIKDNNAGIPICENRYTSIIYISLLITQCVVTDCRLQYLVHKGAILRKGYVSVKFYPPHIFWLLCKSTSPDQILVRLYCRQVLSCLVWFANLFGLANFPRTVKVHSYSKFLCHNLVNGNYFNRLRLRSRIIHVGYWQGHAIHRRSMYPIFLYSRLAHCILLGCNGWVV